MRVDWVPYSASGLVVGAAGLSVGALLMPQPGDPASPLLMGAGEDDRWLAISVLYLLASVGLAVGLPAVTSIFDRRGARWALAGVGTLAVGILGAAAYAVLMSVLRALVVGGVPLTGGVGGLAEDAWLAVLLHGWVSVFAVGEVLIAMALLQARRVSRWVPALMLAHAGLTPLAPMMPVALAAVTALTATIAFAGLGIAANRRSLPPIL